MLRLAGALQENKFTGAPTRHVTGELVMETGSTKDSASNWLWLCPLLGILVAAWVFFAFGFSLWTSLLAALLLVCPALMLWGGFSLRHCIWGRPHGR